MEKTKGGFNWGFCASPEESKRQTVSYSAYVVTSSSPNSTTESEVQVRLCGTKGCFPKFITISSSGFDKQGVKQARSKARSKRF